jgi:hypothetical protein
MGVDMRRAEFLTACLIEKKKEKNKTQCSKQKKENELR